MDKDSLTYQYFIPSDDLQSAGVASSSVKKLLQHLGASPSVIKRTAIAMYEAEINAVIHADGGYAEAEVFSDKIVIKIVDTGPGIPDVDLAMQEGWSTASDNVREMGFGAGLGLPNMKRYADLLEINTIVGNGTTVIITVFL